jgi:hypothetical protein
MGKKTLALLSSSATFFQKTQGTASLILDTLAS